MRTIKVLIAIIVLQAIAIAFLIDRYNLKKESDLPCITNEEYINSIRKLIRSDTVTYLLTDSSIITYRFRDGDKVFVYRAPTDEEMAKLLLEVL